MKFAIRSLCVAGSLCIAPAAAAQRQQAATPPPPPTLSAEATAALDELHPRYAGEIGLIQGWFRDRIVLYYGFNAVPQPVTAGRVLWPIHGFDAGGNPVSMRGQRPIFASLPGLPGYSGVWRLTYVVTADHVQPNQLRDIESVDALVRRRRAAFHESNLTVNLPIVPRGSRLARDSTPAMTGWYQGREIQFFDFGVVSLSPAAMWRFAASGDTAREPNPLEGQNSLLDSIPVSPTYPDLWNVRFVRGDSAYVPNTIKSAAALRSARMVVDSPSVVRNLPVVIVDGARIDRIPSPLSRFADLRSPFPPAPTRPQ